MNPRNPYLCLTIVLMLGSTGLLSLVGIILANFNGREPSASLVAVASACIGSLSSFLVSVPRSSPGQDVAQGMSELAANNHMLVSALTDIEAAKGTRQQ